MLRQILTPSVAKFFLYVPCYSISLYHDYKILINIVDNDSSILRKHINISLYIVIEYTHILLTLPGNIKF